jgi:glycosyltransferase involved in cell wall biosynthesis/SAM-dependent methyltransferase
MMENNNNRIDRHDRVWDAYHGLLGPNFMRDTQQRINWVCENVQGKRVLDIGCSSGIAAILLAREGCEVIGIDSDPVAISEANQHLANEPRFIQERVRFIEADFFAFNGLQNEKFESVIASEILEHLMRPIELIKKASEYMTSGGRLVITVPFGISDFVDHKRTYYLTEPYAIVANYFDVTQVKILGKWIGLVGCLKENLSIAEIRTWDNGHIKAFEQAVFKMERELSDELASAKAKLSEMTQKNKEASSQGARLKKDIAELQAELNKTNLKFQQAQKAQEALKAQIAVKETEERRLKSELKALQDESKLKLQQAQKSQEALKAQIAVKETEEHRLKSELKAREEELRNQIGDLESQIRKVDINLKGQIEREKRYKKEIENAQEKLNHTKNTISFQLGFALIQATKSWANFIGLWKELSRIRQEARLRREKSTEPTPGAGAEATGANKVPVGTHRGTREIETGFPGYLKRLANKMRIKDSQFHFTVKGPLKDLRIAAVMDEFTFQSYNPECNLVQLRPDTYLKQLEEFRPHLLFIESAWKGVEGLWQLKISNESAEINSCIAWCKNKKIPTMFWNKEDPVHFGTFLPLAQKVDFIFTTDIDCIPKYKQALCHDRVYLLPFAAQPVIHNPIEKFERKDAFNFAGSYYQRYPERQRDFALLLDTVKNLKPVDIYDRNYNNPHPHYTFPDAYKHMIIGSLPAEEIDKAYKGYRYGINMNTIKQSQSMFARRVFELLASNTVVVSNYSRAMRIMFGDLVISSDDVHQLNKRMVEICNNDEVYRKLRLLGLRKIMQEHTYAHRLEYIRAKLAGSPFEVKCPSVAVLAVAASAQESELLIANFERQAYPAREMFLLESYETTLPPSRNRIHVFSDASALNQALEKSLENHQFLAVFTSRDYYGTHYLTDLAFAAAYSDALAFGKVSHYSSENGTCRLVNDGRQYQPAAQLMARTSIVRAAAMDAHMIENCLAEPETQNFEFDHMLALDEFHYCFSGSSLDAAVLRQTVEDLPLANQGVSFSKDFAGIAECYQADAACLASDDGLLKLNAEKLFQNFDKTPSNHLQLSFTNDVMSLRSTLSPDKHAYLYTNRAFSREELNLVLNSQFRLDAEHDFEDCRTVFEFLDSSGHKISHAMNASIGSRHALAIHPSCSMVRFGIRAQGPGTIKIKGLVLGSNGELPAFVIGHSPYLVLTKQYPFYDDLYRYGFLHSRVRAYKENDLLVDVFRTTSEPGQVFREFEGIDVASGDMRLLNETLKSGRYKNILVHLLDDKMWEVLDQHIDNIRVTVWVHGAEIQSWQHRSCDFLNLSEQEIERQKKLSDKRIKFWQSILNDINQNLHLIFVSNYLKNQSEKDLNLVLPESSYSIISNYINSDVFTYNEKKPEDRLKILSIRSHSKRVYANDLTTAAIIALSKKSFFDELSFTIIGDGELFDKNVEPLHAFKNIKIIKRFLPADEMADFHKNHGIFLTPTRMDTQGVSRDEAMCSGLVPITSNVGAVPEFVDESCGILVPDEDYKGLAAAVEYLYNNPEAFRILSKKASERVRRQSGLSNTIQREIEIICGHR